MRNLSLFFVLQVSFLGAVAQSAPAKPADTDAIVHKARQSYYSLKQAGVTQFHCKLQPDWDTMYKNIAMDEVGQKQVLPLLKQTRFEVTVGGDGGATVSKTLDAPPASIAAADRYRSASSGMEQILTGFFQTWSAFTFALPIPDAGEKYDLEDLGDSYRVSSGDGANVAVITFGRDYAIKTLHAKTENFDATLNIKLGKTNKDLYLLSGYTMSLPAEGKEKPQLLVDVDYQNLQEVQLPKNVHANVQTPSGEIQVNLVFQDCTYKK